MDAFPFGQLINAVTTHIMAPKGFGLIIQHRFGKTTFDEGFIKNFMGFDLGANIRFAFEIPVNRRFALGMGRTRYGKVYDISGKYLLIQQTKNNRVPLTIAFYENVAVNTDSPISYSDYATFENGSKFEYRFVHRLYYDTQIIFSKRFNNTLSAQFTTEFIWRNLTPYSTTSKEEAYVIAFPVSMRLKLGIRSALDFEIMPNTHNNTLPVSLAYEVASSGNHVFQITITNTDRILPQDIFFYPTSDFSRMEFYLGFNLVRYF